VLEPHRESRIKVVNSLPDASYTWQIGGEVYKDSSSIEYTCTEPGSLRVEVTETLKGSTTRSFSGAEVHDTLIVE
jgi:hypothetical protein